MRISKQEEITAALWAIAAAVAFGFEFTMIGWIFVMRATFDGALSIYFGIKENSIIARSN